MLRNAGLVFRSYNWSSVAGARCCHHMPKNEPIQQFKTGSPERNDLEKKLAEYEKKGAMDIPIVIGSEELTSPNPKELYAPFDHKRLLARFHFATRDQIKKAIDSSLKARTQWERTPFEERAKIFNRAADLISTKYRSDLLATTMLGQGKTIFQAEIDATCELADFLRFNIAYTKKAMEYQPISTSETKNSFRFRGMEGFWAAVSPFNFTAIGGNLASAPAMMGNVVLWKPTDSAIMSNYTVFKIFREAGVPPGVINFIPVDGATFGDVITASPALAGVNFTGSVPTFRTLFKMVSKNIDVYNAFPRLIGETGGKNYHFVHPSADPELAAVSTIRSAFEYAGQKCSACSRLYVPASLWSAVKKRLVAIHGQLHIGSPLEKETFHSALIDAKAYDRVKSYVDYGKQNLELVAGGKCDNSKGHYIHPTIFVARNPRDKIMEEEIFGPVLTVFVYPDAEVDQTLHLVQTTSPFALTGAVFAKDKVFLARATEELKDTAGNFYLNVQSTGAIVGQQPFGGARLSGTNDKAGGPHYTLRFTSPQAVKTQAQLTFSATKKPRTKEDISSLPRTN